MKSTSSSDLKHFGLPEHYRPRKSAALWQTTPADWRSRLAEAMERNSSNHVPAIFFRADDIGAGGKAFQTLCRIFRHHEVPLAMAVVPAWLSDVRKRQLFEAAPLEEPLWGWHQHGWRHINWQRSGKKSEFGEQRPYEKQWQDIVQGRRKMQDIFGDHLIQVFSPPWNNLSASTLRILQELEFKGVSTNAPLPRGPRPTGVFKHIKIQLDLHTRKGADGAADFANLLEESRALLGKKELVGIMIHHQRMTPFAFEFLHEWLHRLKHQVQAHFVGLRHILETEDED